VYRTVRDPEYRADCAKQMLECDTPSTGEEITEVIRRTYAAPERVRQRVVDIYQAER
jgi:hypothetical protein